MAMAQPIIDMMGRAIAMQEGRYCANWASLTITM